MDDAASRRALLVLRLGATVTAVLGIGLLVLMPSAAATANTPGFSAPILGFELATEPAHVFGILGAPDAPERGELVRRFDLGNRLDYVFMLAYATLYVGIVELLAARGRVRGALRVVLLVGPALMMIGDALENLQLLALSRTVEPAEMLAPLGRLAVFTRVKWYALFAESALLVPLLWRESGWWRWSAVPFGLAALAGAASVAHPPLIELGSSLLGVAWLLALVRSYRP